MVAQIYKEEYFLKTQLLEVKLGNCPSHIWKSLWSALDLLKKELVWRVENEKSIKMWKDKWIPSPLTYKVQFPINIFYAEAIVSALIDEDRKLWNR